MKYFRILSRICVEAFIGLWHSKWLNLIIISILLFTLLIFGTVLHVGVVIKNVANSFGSKSEFSVHIDKQADLNIFLEKLRSLNTIERIRIRKSEKNLKDILELLQLDFDESLNPMPNTFIIKVRSIKQVEPTIQKIKSFEESKYIENINYAPDIVKKLQILKYTLIFAGFFLSLLLAFATIVINFNTIELVIRARKEELKLLNFMGVNSWFIKGPFVLQGLIYGITGACLSVIIFSFANSIIQGSLDSQGKIILQLFSATKRENFQIILIIFLTAIIFSFFSSFLATERRLRS